MSTHIESSEAGIQRSTFTIRLCSDWPTLRPQHNTSVSTGLSRYLVSASSSSILQGKSQSRRWRRQPLTVSYRQAFGNFFVDETIFITKDAYATHSMSWSSGSSGPSPFVEEPYLTEAERESIGPLSEWVLNMVRTADGSVSLPKGRKDVDAILLHRPLTRCT